VHIFIFSKAMRYYTEYFVWHFANLKFFGRNLSQTLLSLGRLFSCDIFANQILSQKMVFCVTFFKIKNFFGERKISQIFQVWDSFFCVTIFQIEKCHMKKFSWHFSNLQAV